jgi:hypothetical protein
LPTAGVFAILISRGLVKLIRSKIMKRNSISNFGGEFRAAAFLLFERCPIFRYLFETRSVFSVFFSVYVIFCFVCFQVFFQMFEKVRSGPSLVGSPGVGCMQLLTAFF